MTPATSHDRQQEQAFPPLPLHISTRRKSYGRALQVGDKIEAEDSQKKWYPARIVEVDEEDSCVLIHFDGFNARYDEWIEMGSPKLRVPARRGRDKTVLTHLRIGESVLARWTDGKFYPARITEISDESYRVQFYDGYFRTLSPNHIRPSDNSSRSHSRSGSGRSSGDGVNTPVLDGRHSRRSGSRSRKSSAVSSRATTPQDSPHSPAENGDHSSTNGHSLHADASRAALELVKTTLESCRAQQRFEANGLIHQEEAVRACVMSSVLRANSQDSGRQDCRVVDSGDNGTVPQDPSPVNGVRSRNGNHSHPVDGSVPGNGSAIRVPVTPAAGTKPAPVPISNSGQNGYHITGSIQTTISMAPRTGTVKCPGYADVFSSPIATPSLPEFTPLSPNNSPNRPPASSVLPASSVASPLAVSRPSVSSQAPGCTVSSSGAMPPIEDAVTEPRHCNSTGIVCQPHVLSTSGTGTSISMTQRSGPASIFTPTDSPVLNPPQVMPGVEPPVSQPEPSPSTPEVSQAHVSESRHVEAPAPPHPAGSAAPTGVDGAMVSTGHVRHRSDSESSASGRAKRKKLDGVLAPPPSRVAPKEVIAMQDHNPFKCKVCEKSFRKWPLLEAHYKNYHADKPRELSQSRKEYANRPGAISAISTPTEEAIKQLQPRRRGPRTGSAMASSQEAPTRQQQRAVNTSVKRKEPHELTSLQTSDAVDMELVEPTPVATALVSAAAVEKDVEMPLTPKVDTAESLLQSSPGDAGIPAPVPPPSRTKRKAVGPDGLPPKRGRPPASHSTENTPRLPGALSKPRHTAESTRADVTSSNRRSTPLERSVRIPKSRRSLSFSSSDDSRGDVSLAFDIESPKVKTDAGFVGVPADAVMCCSCRQDSFQAVLVKCTSCWTYQHLMCVSTMASYQPWARYRCRACTHPTGKRRGARDKLPSDWYNSDSVCRNPTSLLSFLYGSRTASDMKPLLPLPDGSMANVHHGPVSENAPTELDESDAMCGSKFVDLQLAASQDVLAVGEVLAAASKQLRVMMQPESPANRMVLSHVAVPRTKPEVSLVSPIRIETEAIGGSHRAASSASTPIGTPSRDKLPTHFNPADFASLHSGMPSPAAIRHAIDLSKLANTSGPSTPSPSTSLLGRGGDMLASSLSNASLQQFWDSANTNQGMTVGASPVNLSRPISPAIVLQNQQPATQTSATGLATGSMSSSPQAELMSPVFTPGAGPPKALAATAATAAAGRPTITNAAAQSPTISTNPGTPMAGGSGEGSSTKSRCGPSDPEREVPFHHHPPQMELLMRVREVQDAARHRLSHLERIVSELEAVDAFYRDPVPLPATTKPEQVASFEELAKELDKLPHGFKHK